MGAQGFVVLALTHRPGDHCEGPLLRIGGGLRVHRPDEGFDFFSLFGGLWVAWPHDWQHELPAFSVQKIGAAFFLEAEYDGVEIDPAQFALPTETDEAA
jgi:hypothetical protein